MRIVSTDDAYPEAWNTLPHSTYEEWFANFFGTHSAWDHAFQKAGHECITLVENFESKILSTAESLNPAVLISQNVGRHNGRELRARFPDAKLVAMCSYRAAMDDLWEFDLVVSSFCWLVDELTAMGRNALYLPLAFDPRVLTALGDVPKTRSLTFVGGAGSRIWRAGTEMLNEVASRFAEFEWHGYKVGEIPDALNRAFRGPAYGLDYYRVMASSRITLNRHGEIARNQTNCLRTFDATGVGTCLLTESFSNLQDLFAPGTEVIGYRDTEELLQLIKVLLDGPECVTDAIGQQGQKKTLAFHTYEHRVPALLAALERV